MDREWTICVDELVSSRGSKTRVTEIDVREIAAVRDDDDDDPDSETWGYDTIILKSGILVKTLNSDVLSRIADVYTVQRGKEFPSTDDLHRLVPGFADMTTHERSAARARYAKKVNAAVEEARDRRKAIIDRAYL